MDERLFPQRAQSERAGADDQTSCGQLGRLPRGDQAPAPYIPTCDDPVEYVIHKGWIASAAMRDGIPEDEDCRLMMVDAIKAYENRRAAVELLLSYDGMCHVAANCSEAIETDLLDFFGEPAVKDGMYRDAMWGYLERWCTYSLKEHMRAKARGFYAKRDLDLALIYAAIRHGCRLPAAQRREGENHE